MSSLNSDTSDLESESAGDEDIIYVCSAHEDHDTHFSFKETCSVCMGKSQSRLDP